MGYHGKWNATDQIPQRAVDDGTISRFGAIDPTDGGRTSRYSLSLDRHKTLENGGVFHMDVYAIKYRLNLFSNFTFFLDNQTNGDQFEQADNRTIIGLTPSWVFTGKWEERQMTNKFGVDARRDDVNVALYHTQARERVDTSTVRSDKVVQTGVGLYYENTLQWTDTFRSIAGVREDFYGARVDSDNPANSGTTNAHITSPKLNFIFGPFDKTEYFLNYGQGFHSNDARGTTVSADPAPALVKTRGEEIGARTEMVPRLQSSLSLWRLTLDSELVFAGDAGTTQASRPSLRRGIEWSNRYIPRSWLLVDFDLSVSRARFTENDPLVAGNYIPGAIDRVASLGVSVKDVGRWSGTVHARYFGPRPLTGDNSQRSQSSTIVSARASYKVDAKTSINLDVFNLFNRKANDIEYYYCSRLLTDNVSSPSARCFNDPNKQGINDIHFHPAEPRTARLALVMHY
jgi:outer membrane receptor protein involved in Fe transport